MDVTFSSVRNVSGLRHMIFTADGQLMLNNQDGTYSVNLSKPYTTLNGTQTNWNDQTHTQRLVEYDDDKRSGRKHALRIYHRGHLRNIPKAATC